MRSTIRLALAFVAAGLVAAPAASARTPVLVVDSAANPFSGYVKEIMRAEGLNGFDSAAVGGLTAAQIAPYDVVVLGDVDVTPAQALALAGWVNGGGNLVALSPDPDLNGLLGIAATGASLDNAYLKVDTTRAPGAGITGATMQYHGTATRYNLAGATAVATLYSSAAAPTTNPAVTLRSVGSRGGEAAAFTFDVARSVALTRQGNPAWAGQDRDGSGVIETSDLFWGGTVPNWVDTNKLSIPQADELQRLLANVITHVNRDRTPVPRFWYLPRGENAAVVMTGDDHNEGGTAARFEQYKAASPAGCVVALWQCVRSTSYIIADPNLASPVSAAQVAAYASQGFEVSVHPWRGGCTTPAPDVLGATYTEQVNAFVARYGSAYAPVTARYHCLAWPDWSSHAKSEIAHGIRLDTNYYHFPFAFGGDHPGYMTGSGKVMRFADSNGTTLGIYQANTHLNDEGMDATETRTAIDRLLGAANGPLGYAGMFMANMHTDFAASPGSDQILASARAHGAPVISARQALTWVQGREGSSFTDVTWSGGRLGFTVAVGSGATGLQGMVPLQAATGRLQALTRNGVAVPVTARTVKGVAYGFFPAAAGRYEARYTSTVATPDRTAPRLRIKSPKRRTLKSLLHKGLRIKLRCSERCRVTVGLTAKIGERNAKLATVKRTLRANRRVTVTVKLKPKAVRRLRRAEPSHVRLRIAATDAAGNTKVVKRRVRLTR